MFLVFCNYLCGYILLHLSYLKLASSQISYSISANDVSGNVLMLSEGQYGIDNVYYLRDGV